MDAETKPAARLGQIGQIALTVKDVARAVSFYRDALGLPFLFDAPPGLAFFDCAGVRLMLSAPEAAQSAAASSTIYFRVGDIEAVQAELSGRGVAFRGPPHRIAQLADHDLWMTFFDDGEGNLMALMSEVRR